MYSGEYSFSEPETQFVKAFAGASHFALVIHAHSYDNYVLFPRGYQYCKPPDHALFQEYENLLVHANNYSFGNSSGMLRESNGDANDWFYGCREDRSHM
ncbi:MAG TPA: M14 family zinc carboxypeptidase [Bacteroidales bacterium]|nr:M14 family zinc carboxypeptidase [Bacteroidales bacterium]